MLILPAEADEALVGTAVGRIDKIVSAHGGAIGQIDRWGRRRFAYELADQHEGYYVVTTFTAEPAAQTELERALNLADEILRHKVMLLPQKKPDPKKAAQKKSDQKADQKPDQEPDQEPDKTAQAASPAPAATTA
jgi:small subunit ribosomal protein S6